MGIFEPTPLDSTRLIPHILHCCNTAAALRLPTPLSILLRGATAASLPYTWHLHRPARRQLPSGLWLPTRQTSLVLASAATSCLLTDLHCRHCVVVQLPPTLTAYQLQPGKHSVPSPLPIDAPGASVPQLVISHAQSIRLCAAAELALCMIDTTLATAFCFVSADVSSFVSLASF